MGAVTNFVFVGFFMWLDLASSRLDMVPYWCLEVYVHSHLFSRLEICPSFGFCVFNMVIMLCSLESAAPTAEYEGNGHSWANQPNCKAGPAYHDEFISTLRLAVHPDLEPHLSVTHNVE